MISVPNRLLLLSGNKYTRLVYTSCLLLSLLAASSCELFKPVTSGGGSPTNGQAATKNNELDPIQSRRVYDPVTGTYVIVQNAPVEKMDTVQWRVISEYEARPITEEGTAIFEPVIPSNPNAGNGLNPVQQTGTSDNGARMLSAYNINFLLPFLANRLDMGESGNSPKIDPNSQWALHFYSGAQMALDDLSNQNLQLNVSAQDTKADVNTLKALLTQDPLRNAHLIFGPYMRNNIAELGAQIKGKEQVMVSPYSAATDISPNNPNYIQVNPTLEVHCRNLLAHALSSQNASEIVLVSTSEQKDRLAFFQNAYRELKKNAQITPLTELIVANKQANLSTYANRRDVIFIVPIYEDESFVANFMRQAYDLSKNRSLNVTVYGLPQWRNFEQVDFNYFEGCNVHISSSVFLDRLDPDVRRFREQFFERFKALPREEAYVGYDVTHYFLRMQQEHGTLFQYQLPRNPEKRMHTEFRFEPVRIPQEGANNFENPRVDRWENTFVNILQFRNYQFTKVN